MTKPKLLILSPRFPFPLEKGDKLRLYNQIKYLAPHFSIHLIALTDHAIAESDRKEIQQFTSGINILEQSRGRTLSAIFQSLWFNKSLQTGYYYEKKIQQKIHDIIAKVEPDIIHVQLIRLADYVKDLPIKKSLDYMDAMSLNMKRESDNHKFPKSWIYRRESRLLHAKERELSQFFDVKWIISLPDKMYLESIDVKDLIVQGNGVDLNYFKQKHTSKSNEFDISFVGNMGYLPNIKASEFLVNEIAASMEIRPNIIIAGARPHKRVKNLANDRVKITGWLEDIREPYNSSKMLVAPIFSGAGQQNKILEAMAMGKACITTTQVNNAIGATTNKEILLADNKEGFCHAISHLLNNPEKREEIAKNARIFVEQNFDWAKQVDVLRKGLISIVEKE